MAAAEGAAVRVALVTGASKGIGQGIAERFAKDGMNVCVHYASDKAGAEETARRVQAAGANAHIVRADVGKALEVAKMFDEAAAHFGGLDVVVNNGATMNPLTPMIEVEEADYDRVMETNAKGAFLVMSEAGRRLKENGRIVCVSSTVTANPRAGFAVYAASKLAVEGFVRVLALELAAKKITVNAVAPGPVDTAMLRTGKTEEQIRHITALSPMNRVGTKEEIAALVSFFASLESSWVTGQIVRTNGGAF